ncbi:MAG: oligopeptide/dipeptide ABC transporter ATP-binding protein, partial [Faecousia sp.]
SVFTKTFANMLDSNGYVDSGKIIFNDPELSDTSVNVGKREDVRITSIRTRLDAYSKLENGAETYKAMKALEGEKKAKASISDEEDTAFQDKLSDLRFQRAEAFNYKQTLASDEKDKIREAAGKIKDLDKQIEALEAERKKATQEKAKAAASDTAYNEAYNKKMSALKEQYHKEISQDISLKQHARNVNLAKEIYLTVGRYDWFNQTRMINKLLRAIKEAMRQGLDLDSDEVRNDVFGAVTFRVKLTDETETRLHGTCVLDLANIKYSKDLTQIRGKKIATVFQDPMTSLNPIITIGQQITSIILKHQHCSEAEARMRALELMKKVGIPNAENRFDDYPFQYSGGMRQRIVIAIALSCQPKILICDEPTTALDVTIQAQILKLIKDLQKEFGYTIVFITHDLGVVANVADRVAVLYAGQIVELGTVEEVFYDPRHPYTWAMLSSLPQLAQRNTKLYSITGTPPSLYNKIVGDPFAPRNPYCLKIDTLKDAPMFKVTDTHYAKTWLLDPRAPKIEKPEAIRNLHDKLVEAFNI